MIALLVALTSLQAPTLDGKVTFTCRAERAEVLLKDLSYKTHIQFETTTLTRDEILLLSVRDKPIREVMDKIAQVTDATWVQDHSVYRLVRPVENQIAERKKHAELRRQFFTAALERLRKESKGKDTTAITKAFAQRAATDYVELVQKYKANPSGKPPAQIFAIQNESPIRRLSRRIFGSIDVPTLMSAVEGHRTVFALSPNRMQRQLRLDSNLLDQYEHEQTVWAEAAGPILAGANPQRNVGGVDQGEYLLRSYQAAVDFTSPNTTDAKLLVAYNDQPRPKITVSVVDSDGNREGGYDVYLSEREGPPTEQKNDKPGSIKIEYGAESEYVQKLQSHWLSGTDLQSASVEVQEQIANPLRFDPDSFTDTDILLSYAKAKDENIIACLGDSAWVQIPTVPAEGRTFLAKLFKSDVGEGDGWVTLAPQDPIVCRRDRADRRALQHLVQAMAREARMPLDAAAAYYSRTLPECRSQLIAQYCVAFDGQFIASPSMGDEHRVYAGVTPGQKAFFQEQDNAKKLLHIPFGSMSTQQRAAMSRLIFDSGLPLNPATSEDSVGSYLFKFEPTEILPNGLTNDGIADIGFTSDVGATPSTKRRDYQICNAELIGNWIARAEAPGTNGQPFRSREDFETVRFGHDDMWDFTLRPLPDREVHFGLDDSVIGKPIPWIDVPESFRNEVEKYVRQVKETLSKPPPN